MSLKPGDVLTVTINGVDYRCVVDECGTFRFPKNRIVRRFIDTGHVNESTYDLNQMWVDFSNGEYSLEEMTEIYRLMGYSVWGFWETFGWEVNTVGNGFEPLEMKVEGRNYPDEWDDYRRLKDEVGL